MTDDRWRTHLHGLLGFPPTDGNEIEVLRNGDRIFPAMLGAIEEASESVDMVTFVYWSGDIADRFASTLAAAARRGCRVRVLLDAVGSQPMEPRLIEQMSSAGCDVRRFRPLVRRFVPQLAKANHRTHRKILVCDRRVGFTGGVGIAEEWTGDARDETEWRDTHLAVRGPAVAGLSAAFIENWSDDHHDAFDPAHEPPGPLEPVGSSACIVVRGSSQAGSNDMWRLALSMIALAERHIRIASAYFNPDERMLDELGAAAARGVDVSILVPGKHADKRFVQLAGQAAYEQLMEQGVQIREFAPTMMHAKVITVDGAVATVGSANFNQRSMQLDEETNVVIFDADVVETLDGHYVDDVARSVDLDLARWADRRLRQRVLERLTSLFDRWF